MGLDREGYDENTLFKVYDSLRAAGLDEQKARETISDMQNKGILFRERQTGKSAPVMRD
jgi:hypothetical protein